MFMKLDPWGSASIRNYGKLFEEFGIAPFEDLLRKIPSSHPYMRRRIIFGHRDYERILDAMHRNERFAVMSGFMPSGPPHLGGKMVMDEIIWHQQMGGDAFPCIADMEARFVRDVPWRKCKEIGTDYILSLIALGFDVDRGYIYFQSRNETVKDLAFDLGAKVNFTELSDIYGFSSNTSISHVFYVLVDCADILLPQTDAYGSPKPVVIPVGVDQDPHIRLARDLSDRLRMFRVERREDYISVRSKNASHDMLRSIASRLDGKVRLYERHVDVYDVDLEQVEKIVRSTELEFGGHGFITPSSIYHRLMSGLTGEKMSSSIPESYVSLVEDPNDAVEKVMNAKTGGRVTLSEQKKLGGEPDKCSVYELLLFHLIEDDEKMKELLSGCKNGEINCKDCKSLAADLMRDFLENHQTRREDARHEFGREISQIT